MNSAQSSGDAARVSVRTRALLTKPRRPQTTRGPTPQPRAVLPPINTRKFFLTLVCPTNHQGLRPHMGSDATSPAYLHGLFKAWFIKAPILSRLPDHFSVGWIIPILCAMAAATAHCL